MRNVFPAALTGTVSGFGPEKVLTRETLPSKHGLGSLKLPSGSAVLSFPALGEDIVGAAGVSNPGPFLLSEQKINVAGIAECSRTAHEARARLRWHQFPQRRSQRILVH